MIRYTNDQGLRDFRIEVARTSAPRRLWPWLLLLTVVIVVEAVYGQMASLGLWR